MSFILSVNEMSLFYGRLQAIFKISFSIQKGKISAILGTNGAGKTTLLKAITGLIPCTTGSISYFGQPLHTVPRHERVSQGIAMSCEGRLVFPDFTVQENLNMGGYVVKERIVLQNQTEFVLSLFPRLKERWRQKASNLSGGEQQMLAIGRALMSSPKLLLLDEPLLGIAPAIAERVFTAIEEINQTGVTIVLVEQNAFAALNLSDHAFILENGHLVKEGCAKTLINDDFIKTSYLGE